MIKCKVKKNGLNVEQISVSGHADYSDYGSDIVCSAVSMICYTIGNALLNQSEEFSLLISENEFRFIDNINTTQSRLLMTTLLDGLLMVEQQYNDFINIKEV